MDNQTKPEACVKVTQEITIQDAPIVSPQPAVLKV